MSTVAVVNNKFRHLVAVTAAALRSSVLIRTYDPAKPKETDDGYTDFAALQEAVRDNPAGGFAAGYRSVAGNVTLAKEDYAVLVDSTAAGSTVTMASAALLPGKVFIVKKTVAGNTVTIDPAGAETIGGGATAVLKAVNDYAHIISDGTNWQILHAVITP